MIFNSPEYSNREEPARSNIVSYFAIQCHGRIFLTVLSFCRQNSSLVHITCQYDISLQSSNLKLKVLHNLVKFSYY